MVLSKRRRGEAVECWSNGITSFTFKIVRSYVAIAATKIKYRSGARHVHIRCRDVAVGLRVTISSLSRIHLRISNDSPTCIRSPSSISQAPESSNSCTLQDEVNN